MKITEYKEIFLWPEAVNTIVYFKNIRFFKSIRNKIITLNNKTNLNLKEMNIESIIQNSKHIGFGY